VLSVCFSKKLSASNTELQRSVSSAEKRLATETTRLSQSVADYRTRVDTLNHQLTTAARERSVLECDLAAARRREEAAMADNCQLKEEVCTLSQLSCGDILYL
jgi:septal ring factor EnvC (AmiA/AmiB activator)